MADINTEVYAVVDKSKKKQTLPEDETAESDPPPSIPERSEPLNSEYPMTTADTLVTKETEKNSGVAFESTMVAASDATYSAITAENSAKQGEGAKKDANVEPTPGNHEGYATLQHSTTLAPAKPPRSFYSDYSMITMDNVHSTVNDGDLPSQQPAETDVGTGKTVAKTAAEDKRESADGKGKTTIKCVLIFIAIASIIALTACIAFLFVKIANLEAKTAFLQPGKLAQDPSIMLQLQQINDNISSDLNISINNQLSMSLDELELEVDQIQETQLNTSESLHMLFEELDLSTDQLNSSIEAISGDIIAIEDKTQLLIDYFQIGQSEESPSPSCAALRGLSPSGHYWVRTSNGSAVRVYCDMTRSCGGVTGGWVRVANLDKTNSSQNGMCPGGLGEHMFSSRPTCRRADTSAGCSSVQFPTHELSYSRVCGQITAFTEGRPDGFMRTNVTDINGTYVDGVSLTHGAPRQHIWTFAATSSEMLSCSCNNSNTAGTPPPEYVGNDYFCDTRFRESGVDRDLVLWQGTDCTSSNACCSFNNPPWFYKQLPQPTTDDIEIRVCRDENRKNFNEDVFIQIAEVYIQ